MFEPCPETVSVLYAFVFGQGDACLDIGIGSLMWAFAAFMVVVIILQFGARKLWNRIRNPNRAGRAGTQFDEQDGPIRPSKR